MASDSLSRNFTIAATTTAAVVIGAVSLVAYNNNRKKTQPETWESHISTTTTGHDESLQNVWPNVLYVLEAKGSPNGPPTRNMIIYKMPSSNNKDNNNKLVIYNGIAVHENIMEQQILKLGEPTILVIPNMYHRCCAAVWKRRFPNLLVVTPSWAINHVQQVVPVDCSTEDWLEMPEWKDCVQAKTIDGYKDFELILEFALNSTKKAMVVCDLFFTVPHDQKAGSMGQKFAEWLFDSCITLPESDNNYAIIIPKVARLSRIFAIKDWKLVEEWYRTYAREQGSHIAAIVCGHGVIVQQVDPSQGCTVALEGIANQLTNPRW